MAIVNRQSAIGAQTEPAPAKTAAPLDEKTAKYKTLTGIIYSLYAATVFFGIPAFVAITLNYINRSKVSGTWLETHFRWQIRTFWVVFLMGTVAAVGYLSGWFGTAGFVAILVPTVFWLLSRNARGWTKLNSGKPIHGTW